jgi:hypothetical protein
VAACVKLEFWVLLYVAVTSYRTITNINHHRGSLGCDTPVIKEFVIHTDFLALDNTKVAFLKQLSDALTTTETQRFMSAMLVDGDKQDSVDFWSMYDVEFGAIALFLVGFWSVFTPGEIHNIAMAYWGANAMLDPISFTIAVSNQATTDTHCVQASCVQMMSNQ